MPEGYRHLTFDERCRIYATGKSGLSNGAIARRPGRHPATMSREIRRDGGGRGYRQGQARRMATGRRNGASSVPGEADGGAPGEGRGEAGEGWSPEQVPGRLRLEDPGTVGRQRIYDLVRADRGDGGTLCGHLQRRGKKRNRQGSRHAGRSHIPGRRDIPERPEIVDRKVRIGDREADTVIGGGHGGAVVSPVDWRRNYRRQVGYPGPIGQYPGLHRPCQAPGGPDRTADPEGRDGPAPREGAPDIRAAHPLDIEGKGRGPGGARRPRPRP